MGNTQIFTKRVRYVLLAALVIAVFIAVASTTGAGRISGAIKNFLSPMQSLSAAVARTAERYYNYAFNYENLEAENAVLRKKITSMEEDIRDVSILQRENNRYKELLVLAEDHDNYNFLPAYIIAWDTNNWSSAFTVSKGTLNGIKKGMCAVTEFGQVIGMVSSVGEDWAVITTVQDTALEVSASVASTGYTGVVEGSYREEESGKLRLNYLPTDSVLKNGDQVVTTGSSLYPKDLIIGFIIDAGLDETGVSKYALLESPVQFDSLEQVFIITNYVMAGIVSEEAEPAPETPAE